MAYEARLLFRWRRCLLLGEPHGSALIGTIVTLLHAICAERSRCFSFMPADCPICSRRLSEEEQMTLDLLRAACKCRAYLDCTP